MKKVMKHGILVLTMGFALTAMGGAASAAPVDDSTTKDGAEAIVKQLERNPEANCLDVFASLYLNELEQQHAKAIAMAEVRALAVAQMQTAPLAAHADSIPGAAAPEAQATPAPAPKPAPKPAAKPAAKPAPAKAAKPKAATAKTVVTNKGKTLTYKKVLSVRATAYSAHPSENGGWAGLDYMGNSLKLGTIAVDPKVIPLGSTVYITGYTAAGLPVKGMIGKATDIGGAIKGNKIDIFIPGSMSLVENFGIQNVQVYIL